MGQYAAIKFDSTSVHTVNDYYHTSNAVSVNQVYDRVNDTMQFYSTGYCLFNQMTAQITNPFSNYSTFSCDSFTIPIGGMTNFILPSVTDSMSMYLVTSTNGAQTGVDLEVSWTKFTYNGTYFESVWDTTISNLGFYGASCPAVVRHGNGRDYWVLFHGGGTQFNTFKTILFSDSTIQQMFTQNAGPTMGVSGLKFNHSGNKLAVSGYYNYSTILFDFDRCTGLLSNPDTIRERGTNEVEFSPNDSLLYATYIDSVLQYDLTNSNIPGTETLIYATKWFTNESRGLEELELAEDGKIYLSSSTSYSNNPSDTAWGYLDIIHRPDAPGTQCDYEAFAVYLDGNKCWGNLPYVFEYDMGPLVNSPCDTLSSTTGISSGFSNTSLISLAPNPAQTQATLTWAGMQEGTFVLRDMLGRAVLSEVLNTPSGTTRLDLAALPKGIYLWQVQSATYSKNGKLVVE
jgi:hypothetical protein